MAARQDLPCPECHNAVAVFPRIASLVVWSSPNSWVKSLKCCVYVDGSPVGFLHHSSQGKLLPHTQRSGPNALITCRQGSCRSRNGYFSADPVGMNVSLVYTFGCLASRLAAGKVSLRFLAVKFSVWS